MQRHEMIAVAAFAALLFCSSTTFADPPKEKRAAETESAEPGAMPKERARIMGYGPDDPRAAADARRNLDANQEVLNEQAKMRKEDRRKAKAAAKR